MKVGQIEVSRDKLSMSKRNKRDLLRAALNNVASGKTDMTAQLRGELAYIKQVNSQQYLSLITHFAKRVAHYEKLSTSPQQRISSIENNIMATSNHSDVLGQSCRSLA
jgi:hypothetical protein